VNEIHQFIQFFLASIIALLPLVNPIGNALVFLAVTASFPKEQVAPLALRVAINVFFVLIAVQFGGDFILKFFGISLPIVRVGGGLLVFHVAWGMLNAKPKLTEEEHHESTTKEGDVSFVPLTIPITAGPGTIAVTLALVSKVKGETAASVLINQSALAAAIFVLAISIYLCFRFSNELLRVLGKTGANALTKIIALLVLFVGVAMLVDGLTTLFPGLA
jgi:multiple antibiotic resistance protein